MKHFLLSAALLITFAACHKQAENQQSAPRDIMTVNPSSVTISQNYSAAIEGRQDVAILPDVGGKLTQVKVKEGQHVNKGDVLFVIDQVPFRAAVETAEANVEAANAGVATAELVYRSKQILFNDSIVSDFELQTSKNNWLTAKSGLAQAKAAFTASITPQPKFRTICMAMCNQATLLPISDLSAGRMCSPTRICNNLSKKP